MNVTIQAVVVIEKKFFRWSTGVPARIDNSTDATYLQIVIPFIQAARINELQALLHCLWCN